MTGHARCILAAGLVLGVIGCGDESVQTGESASGRTTAGAAAPATDTYEAVTKERLRVLRDLKITLQSVNDVPTAQAAGPKLAQLENAYTAVKARRTKLGQVDSETRDRVDIDYQAQVIHDHNEVLSEFNRISTLQQTYGQSPVFDEVKKHLSKLMTADGSGMQFP